MKKIKGLGVSTKEFQQGQMKTDDNLHEMHLKNLDLPKE